MTVTPVAGGPTLTADLSFLSALDQDGGDIVVASASNVRFAFVAGSRQVVSLTNGSGLLIVATGGKIAGSLSGTVAIDVPGVSFSGTLALQVNTTGLAVDTLASVGLGAATLVSLAGGAAYVRFAATGAQLQVLGQRLSGDFAVTSSSGTVSLTVANARLDLAGGIASITGASGTFTFGAAGISGNFTGTPSLALPGVQFFVPVGSSIQAQLDTTGATRFVRISGANVELQVAGQSLKGDFTLEAGTGASGGPVVKIAVVNTSPTTNLLQVGPLTIADGTGQIVMSSAGVAASISIAAAQLSLGITGVGFSGGVIDIAVNTGAAPVTESFLIGTTPTLLTLPGGPYVSIRLLGSTLTLGGNSLTGNFVFESAGGVTRLAATNLSASIGGAAALKEAQGAFLITSSGIAGYATGKADLGAGIVAANAEVALRVNTTGGPVDTTITLGGQTIPIKFEGNAFELSLSAVTLNIGNFVSLEGSFTYQTITVGTSSAQAFAGEGISLFLGRGPARLGNGDLNPLAMGVLLTNARIGLVSLNGGHALVADGVVSLVGVNGLTITGNASIRVNTTGTELDVTITIPGSTAPGVRVAFERRDDEELHRDRRAGRGRGQLADGRLRVRRERRGRRHRRREQRRGGARPGVDHGRVGPAAHPLERRCGPALRGRLARDPGRELRRHADALHQLLGRSRVRVGRGRRDDGHAQPARRAVPARRGDRDHADGARPDAHRRLLDRAGHARRRRGRDGDRRAERLVLTGLRLLRHRDHGRRRRAARHGRGHRRRAARGRRVEPARRRLGHGLVLAARQQHERRSRRDADARRRDRRAERRARPDRPVLGHGCPARGARPGRAGGHRVRALDRLRHRRRARHDDLPDRDRERLARLRRRVAAAERHGRERLDPRHLDGVAGKLQGTIALHVPGVSLSGAFAAEFNTTGNAFDADFQLGAIPTRLKLELGTYVRVAGTNVDVVVLGQSLRGDFSLTRSTGADGLPAIQLTAKNAVLKLGGTAAAPILTATQKAGTATLTIGRTGVVGSLSVDVALALPNAVLDATASLAIELDSAAGLVRVRSLAPTKITVQGLELQASFAFEQTTTASGAKIVRVGVSGGQLSLATGLVSVSAINGLLIAANGGLAGSLAGAVSIDAGAGFSLSGSFSLAVNTTGDAVAQSFVVGGTTVSVDVPAGPFVRVTGVGVSLIVAGQRVSGDFVFEQITTALGQAVRVALANGTFAIGDGAQAIVSLTQATGALIVVGGANKGIAGRISGNVSLGVDNFSLTGSLALAINTRAVAVDETFVVNGFATRLQLPAGPFVRLTGTGVSLTAGGARFSGNFTFERTTLGTENVVSASFSNVEVALGPRPPASSARPTAPAPSCSRATASTARSRRTSRSTCRA